MNASQSAIRGRVAVLLAAAALALLVDIWTAGSGTASALARHGRRDTAVVTSLDDPGSGVFYPDGLPIVGYTFKLQGKRYHGLGRVSRGRYAHLPLGAQLEIVYLPKRPSVNMPADDVKRPPSRLTVGALVAFVNGLAGLALIRVAVLLLRRTPRAAWLPRFKVISRQGNRSRHQSGQ